MNEYQYVVNTANKNEWTDLIGNFRDSSIYQTWSYGEVRWGLKNLCHFVLLRDGKPAAAAQVVIRRIPLIGAGIAYVPWGPMWRLEGEQNNVTCPEQLLKALKKEFAEKRD